MDWTRCVEIDEEARCVGLSEDETLVIPDVFACTCFLACLCVPVHDYIMPMRYPVK